MTFEITTQNPSKIRSALRINAADVMAYVAERMDAAGDEVGLPDGATLFIVTSTSGDGKIKRQAIRNNEANGVEMYLEVPFYQNADGSRTAIGGRARLPKGEDVDNNDS